VRERLDIDAAEQVMHHGIAHDRDVPHRAIPCPRRRQFGDQCAHALPDEACERLRSAGRQAELHPAHDVAAVDCLGVQRRPHRQDVAGAEIEQLPDQGGGPQIDGNGQPLARRELKGGIVGQDGGVPLRDFERQGNVRPGVAGQPPAFGELASREQGGLLRRYRQRPLQQLHPAPLAAAPAAARKLHAVSE